MFRKGDDIRSDDEVWAAFVAAQPSVSPMPETRVPSGKVLGRDFYYDSAGRTLLGNTVTDQMGGGGTVPPDCECVVANLAEIYEVVVDGIVFPGIIDVEIVTTGGGDTCSDRGFAGGPNDFGVSAYIDFLSPNPTKWQLGLDNGSLTPTLYKIAGSGTDPLCDIASPVGHYEGDGYTATVSAI